LVRANVGRSYESNLTSRVMLLSERGVSLSGLRATSQQAHVLLTVRKAWPTTASEEQQLGYATSIGRALLTHDRHDFRRLHRCWRETGSTHAHI
jgi:hypothetical protein